MMDDGLELRVLHGVSDELRRAVAESSHPHESVALGWFSISTPSRALIVRRVVPLPVGALASSGVRTEFSHRALVRAMGDAAAAGCGVCILHQHFGSGPPTLSATDLRSFTELAFALASLFPSAALASIVVSQDWHAEGLARLPGGRMVRICRARWLGGCVEVRPAPMPLTRERGSRHDVLWGAAGEGRLRAVRVGVLGAGGGGSHVLQQLAHAGIGCEVAVDPDCLDESNRSRVVGTRSSDVGKLKVTAMRRVVADAGDGVELVQVTERFPSRAAVEQLAKCDVLVSCVDTLDARKEVMAFAWQHAIPLVDIGLSIDPRDPLPGAAAIGGQVFIGVPGAACMWCAGILSNERLRDERDLEGYVRGGGAAQVVSLNGVLASQAVTEVLNLVTGFMDPTLPPTRLVYDGRSLFPVRSERRVTCPLCASVGFGDPSWQSAA
jgi:hypothetical protein